MNLSAEDLHAAGVTTVVVPRTGRPSQARAALGDPITTIRSPSRITSSPPGSVIDVPRMRARTRESSGRGASAPRSRPPPALISRGR